MAKNKSNKKIKCPLCDERYKSIEGLYEHLEDEHDDEMPKDFTPARYMYYIKTGKVSGSCVIDKKPTEWNESTGKYHRFCNNPKCKEEYVNIFKNRMINKYGKVNLLKDPEQQKKMLAHRKISGEYKWTDGTKVTYIGSYEKEFLQFLDVFMNFESSDIMAPSPHTYYYKYNGEELFYIPDFYIPSLKLEIEIKDGGNNPNMHGKIQAVDKVKERLKDEVMYAQKDYDYIKIVNKNYDNFFEYLLQKKEDFIRDNEDVIDVEPVKEANLYGYITRQDIEPSKIKSPQDLNNILNTYQYGILTKDKKTLTNDLTSDEFFEVYRSLSVEDFETYKVGLSLDYICYQEYYFKKHFDYKYRLFYIELDNETSSSHNFMVYFTDDKYYYFESAYKKYQGIKEFDDMESLFNHVLSNMFADNGGECDFIIYEYKNMPSGLSRVGFEDMLLAFGHEVPHKYK